MIARTNARGTIYVDRYPIRRAGMACDSATRRKYKLKKDLNWLLVSVEGGGATSSNNTTGINVTALYFAFETTFAGYRFGSPVC